MLFIPYRAKNPPERYPYVTLGLLVANILIFAATSHYFLFVRESVVKDFAISHNEWSFLRLLTSMFLHGDLMHLVGNMLFLWIFGASVEGRLRPLKFTGVYLLAGLAGTFLEDIVIGYMHPDRYGLGASGAIMGLAGAYLYMFPFSTIRIFVASRFKVGIVEWHAQWVILMYAGFDLLNGFLFGGMDGIAHFAHLGGCGIGLGAVLALRAKRDSEDFSEAQAMRSDVHGDYSILAYHELEALMEHPAEDVRLVLAYCNKALRQIDGTGGGKCLNALRRNERLLMEKADPETLAVLALNVPAEAGLLEPIFYLRLASRVEAAGAYETAARLYQRIAEVAPANSEAEMALFRLARLYEQTSPDRAQAAKIYGEMLRRFPHGSMAVQARAALQRLGMPVPQIVFSPGHAPAAPAASVATSPGTPSPATPVSAASSPEMGDLAAVGQPSISAPSTAPADDLMPLGGGAPPAGGPDDDLAPIGGFRPPG